jgi:hypothetical protein
MNVAQSALGHALEEVMIRAIYSRLNPADFSQSVLAGHPDKFAVMSISDVEWSDLGVPERAIALRSREIKIGRPIGMRHSSADSIAANDAASLFGDSREESHETPDMKRVQIANHGSSTPL